jgi:GntR family transcriptional regulator
VGTFVLRTLAGESLANQAELREDLVVWLRRAQAAGLTAEDVVALVDTTIRATLADGLLQEESA